MCGKKCILLLVESHWIAPTYSTHTTCTLPQVRAERNLHFRSFVSVLRYSILRSWIFLSIFLSIETFRLLKMKILFKIKFINISFFINQVFAACALVSFLCSQWCASFHFATYCFHVINERIHLEYNRRCLVIPLPRVFKSQNDSIHPSSGGDKRYLAQRTCLRLPATKDLLAIMSSTR